MADSPVDQGRPAKKMKLVGRDFCGKIPKVFLDGENNIVKMEFHIHDFANRKQKRGETFHTGIIKAHDHLWKLAISPRGHSKSNVDVVYVAIGLQYNGKNSQTDPVVTKACIRTKSINNEFPRYEYSKKKQYWGCKSFGKRKDIIKNDCNEAGTLTVTVELQVATEKSSVWYPQLTSCDYTRLYESVETSDVTVMAGTKEFQLHKCVLADRTRVLYELVRTEEESVSSSSSSGNNNCIVVLANVDEIVFEVLIQFVYSGEEPNLNNMDEETMKSLLVAANRLGVTELKLYVESLLVEKFLVPSKAAAFLLFADAYSCGFLKERAMNVYITDSTTFMKSVDDWKALQESNKLLVELLVYSSSDRKRYSSMADADDGDGTREDATVFDVTSLRERLQQVHLDVDGSREILVERWKEYLLANNKNNNETTAMLNVNKVA